jgi:hypothetical protein
MFAPLPKTAEMKRIKEDLLANMEDKYEELKQSGKSENEAIGIVISEFGNIDELVKELDIDVASEEADEDGVDPASLTDEQVDDYLDDSTKTGKLIGFGVGLCIAGAASLVLLSQLAEDGLLFGMGQDTGAVIGVVTLFLLVAPAVGLFIYSGMVMEKHKYLGSGFYLPADIRVSLEHKYELDQRSFTTKLIAGVALCILSPAPLILLSIINDSAAVYGVVILLLMVALAVNLFVTSGTKHDAYRKLLKKGSGKKGRGASVDTWNEEDDEKSEPKIIRAISAVLWPFVTILFLITGFFFHMWHINWILFAIAGLFLAMINGVYSAVKEKA